MTFTFRSGVLVLTRRIGKAGFLKMRFSLKYKYNISGFWNWKMAGSHLIYLILYIGALFVFQYNQHLIVYFYLLLAISYPIFLKYRYLFFGKYTTCPRCEKSILVYDRWQCDSCNNIQKKDRFIYQDCAFCKKQLKRVYCEHCHGEISVYGL